MNVFREALNEPSIEVSEPQEGLHFILIHWGRPIPNTSNLDQVHCYRVVRDDHSEVRNHGLFELTLVCSKVELVLIQEFCDSLDDLSVFLKGLCEDEDIV